MQVYQAIGAVQMLTPSRKLTVTVNLPGGPQFIHQDFDASFTLGDLKAVLLDSTLPDGFPEHTWVLRHNQRTFTAAEDAQSIQQAGFQNDDMIDATPEPSGQAAQMAFGGRSRPQRQMPAQSGSQQEIEGLRQHFLSQPSALAELRQQLPQVANSVNDREAFHTMWNQLLVAQREREAAANMEDQRLNDDVNEENQAKILDRIRREKIQKDYEAVYEDHPELLGRVTMLYVNLEVNGHPVKAFVDSGAQATIISPSCAETCGLTHLIDERFESIARGVGTAKILGRIHKAPVKIGYDELTCSFTVLEGKDVDMLFGLDMLKRYQASINLSTNQLEFPGGMSVPFLPENEIPRAFEGDLSESSGGSQIGAHSSAGQPASGAAPGPSSSSARPQPAPSNFRGAGQALGPASSSAVAAPSAPVSQPASRPAQSAAAPVTGGMKEEHIQKLMELGASRQQAIEALQAAEGNVEVAAGIIFSSL